MNRCPARRIFLRLTAAVGKRNNVFLNMPTPPAGHDKPHKFNIIGILIPFSKGWF